MSVDPAIAAEILGVEHWSVEGTLAALTKVSESAGCLFLTIEPSGLMLTMAAAHPEPAPGVERLSMPKGYGVMGLVAANCKPAVLDADSPRDPVHRQLLGLAKGDVVARLCLPVPGLTGKAIGVLSLHRSADHPYQRADADALAATAALIGLRWETEQLERRTARAHSEQDALVAQAISAQEAERRRIAGDLHDGVTQVLVSMNFRLSAASSFLADPDASARASAEIAAARELSARAYDETRTAISGLHSLILDDLGLVAALESLAQTSGSEQLNVDFTLAPGSDVDDLPNHISSALYRIAQETLHNAIKHSSASSAQIELSRLKGRTVLTVSDDGVGFDTEPVRSRSLSSGNAEHFGLSSIAERCALIGAGLRIDSAPGRGTTVVVDLHA